MQKIQAIINLYKNFNRYKDYSQDEIFLHILPSIKLKQYKLHYNNKQLIGFSNWAFLNEQEEQHFLDLRHIKETQWCSGDRVWLVDLLAKDNLLQVADWTKQHFTQLLGCNKKVKWQRVYSDKVIQKSVQTKRHFV